MMKRVIVAGVLGFIVLALWTFVVNGIFGLRHTLDMKQVTNERQVYETLKINVPAPGRYICNPPITESGFVLNEPVFSVQYSGFGHEAAGRESITNMLLGLLSTLLAAFLLSLSGDRIFRSYVRRLLYFSSLGLFVALASEMGNYGIGGYPLGDTVIMSVETIVKWTIVGLVVAWWLKPVAQRAR
ncbi:hypothetical protein C3F09_01990 [candidate division GN15 bacterium]|uniref:Uncharacterized protein n=1 Tax=candidate division GN15 bacterium TaxID=2072418 RepID=A0A855X6K8_9BACT|nr:MAG: hypothetical protein C3F09_01990 [candidate division GN15 bacterium]